MKRTPALVAALAGIVLLGTPGIAQRKPDPKPVAPGADREARISGRKAEFLHAYDRAGGPRLYIFTHLQSLHRDEAEKMDDSVILDHFHARFWDHFAHPDVDLVNQAEAQIRDQAIRDAFDDDNLQTASQLLGNDVDADIVIAVKIQELQRRADGAKYSCTYWINNRKRGETIGSHSWFMYPDKGAVGGEFTAQRIDAYAREAAMRAMRDLGRAFPGGDGGSARKFTLQFTGIPGRRFREVRDSIDVMDGVERVYRPRFKKGPGETLATLDVKYDGDPLDLAIDTTLAVEKSIEMLAEFTSAGEGTIVFAVSPMPLTTNESLLSGGEITATNRAIRDRLSSAYDGEGRPRIGIMVNKLDQIEQESSEAMDDAEADEEAQGEAVPAAVAGAGQTVNVIMQPRINVVVGSEIHGETHEDGPGRKDGEQPGDSDEDKGKSSRIDLNALDTIIMEQSLNTRFSQLGLTCVNLAQAQRLLEVDKQIVGQVHDQAEMVRLLGIEANIEIMIAGAGFVERTGDQARLVYTFGAYNVDDATFLGGANARRDVTGFVDTGLAGEELAAEITGKLAVQMLQHWEPPQTLQVRVSNCHSPRELQVIRDLIKDRIPGVVDTIHRGFLPGAEDGLGIFEVEYTSSYDELTKEIYQAKDLPFDLDIVLSTRERINIRITEKLD